MFAKQAAWSASLVALCSAAPYARAEGDVSPQGDGEAWVEDVKLEVDDRATPEPRELPPEAPPPRQEPKPPTGRFVLGAGFSSVEGFIASASIVQDDLFRTGNHLSLHAQISARRQLFLLRFADPDVLGSRFGLSIDLYNDLKQRPAFEREATGTSLTVSHPIVGRLRAFVGYRIEDVGATPAAGVTARTVDTPLLPLTGGVLSALRTGVVYDTLDRRDAPMRGSNLGASIEIADRWLGSDLQFVRTDAWARTHQPLGPFTLHLMGSLTAITGPGGAPATERLFLETLQEVRGYHPLAFGPVDSLGRPIGGEAKLLGSAELELPLVRRIGLSAIGFADVGSLYDRSAGAQVGRSVGFGLLWRSPIGPLRFSWAFPEGRGKPMFVFGVGL